ncbi:MAG: ribose 5-phosphate isomerase A [Bdellovibrionales bacterium]|nr:ribose 5-phosphate isomerase A [Bdellovibrionales bacterium]
MKQLLGKLIAQRVSDGDVLGLGTGSTAEAAIAAIGARIRQEGLSVKGVVTSLGTAHVAAAAGIEVLSSVVPHQLSWAFDGADEVDDRGTMIKGGGGALLEEKIIAKRAGGIVVLVTAEKLVKRLGQRIPLPVEVRPSAADDIMRQLFAMGASEVQLRKAVRKSGPVITDSGNFILDVTFPEIKTSYESEIKLMTGVVENGLFVGLANEIMIADEGEVRIRRKDGDRWKEEPVSLPS